MKIGRLTNGIKKVQSGATVTLPVIISEHIFSSTEIGSVKRFPFYLTFHRIIVYRFNN